MADSPANAPQSTAVAHSSQPPLAGLDTAALHTLSPPLLKRRLSAAFDPPTLTGAAALADEQRLSAADDGGRQRLRPPPPPPPPPPQQTSTRAAEPPPTSPNPAARSLNALRNGRAESNLFSKPAEAPIATMTTTRPQLPSITQTATTAEPMSLDTQQTTSPTSITSADGLGSKAASALDTRPDDVRKPPSDSGSAQEERQRPVAMTYPGPQPLEAPNGPSRQMSLPMHSSTSRSPNKKHRCPHCATEFTRHHNLKSHLLTHSQEKPYACQTCHARFRRLHDLKRHNKLHTGERPHICDRCGRKFARGDALARHNKGPGGCAGRRASMDEDYIEGESGYGDGMEGVVYNEGSASGETQADYDRRKSEPGHRKRAPTLQSQAEATSSPFRQHSSTYPGSAALAAQSRNQFAQPMASPSHLTPSGGGASSYSSQLNAGPGVFAQGGMTESPKPLSPGQSDPRRLSAANEGSYFRGRSPSHAQFSQSSQYGRGAGRGTPPVVSLPPGIQHGHVTQLPPIKAATGQYAPTGPAGSTSNAGSSVSSSAQQSSGSSLRELSSLSGPHAAAGVPADVNLYEHVKYLERQVAQLKEDNAVSERHYETKIARIMDENRELRVQLSNMQQGRA